MSRKSFQTRIPLPPFTKGGEYEEHCICDTVSFTVMTRLFLAAPRLYLSAYEAMPIPAGGPPPYKLMPLSHSSNFIGSLGDQKSFMFLCSNPTFQRGKLSESQTKGFPVPCILLPVANRDSLYAEPRHADRTNQRPASSQVQVAGPAYQPSPRGQEETFIPAYYGAEGLWGIPSLPQAARQPLTFYLQIQGLAIGSSTASPCLALSVTGEE